MPIDDPQSIIGHKGDPATWIVEYGKVREFAKALGFTDPLCLDADAAREAGFSGVVAPPTFPIASTFWMTGASPIRKAGLDLRRVLHGEQGFEFHRPVVAGDVLTGTPEVVNVRTKEGKRGGVMTFVDTEIVWRDGSGDPVVTARSTILETAAPVKKED